MQIDSLLAAATTVAIAGHVNPDGDCVGSCLGMYNYIRRYFPHVQVTVYLEEIPNIFKFMTGADLIVHSCEKDLQFDLFIAQDCGDTRRLGEAAKYFSNAKKTICIDHHISNQNFADENYIFPEASSTSELVYQLLPKERLTKEIGECLYTGIVHDTGVFQYSCTSKSTMEAAGNLMDLGVDFTRIVEETFFAQTYEQNRILGLALQKSRRYLENCCIVSVITKKEMEEYQVLPKHLDGIVSQLRVTKGVEVALFLYEKEPGQFKASLRSKNYADVSAIAVAHGGGGHVRAAGFDISGEPDKIIDSLLPEIHLQLEQ